MDAQERFCRQRAEQLGFEVLGVFSDEGSGKDELEDREGLQALIDAVKACPRAPGGESPVVLAYEMTRLARSLDTFVKLIKLHSLVIVIVTQPFDMSTPMGEMVAGMLAVFAQFEGRMISERTKHGLSEVKARGGRLGGARTAMDTLSPAVLGRIRALSEDGLSHRRIAEQLNKEGVPTVRGHGRWSYDNVGRALKLPSA